MSFYNRPLRPTRAFQNASEQYKITDIVKMKSIYSHTNAYLYITQDGKTLEYKIFSKGTIYAENLLEIIFQDTKDKIITDYIPIYKDTPIEISYSNIQLAEKSDISKLKKLTLKPNAPDNKNCFYIKNEDNINRHIVYEEMIKKAKYKPLKNDKIHKVACIIEDILGEIEDMYDDYHTSFKLAYAHNVQKINEIQKQNSYPYTICNILNYFYVDDKRANIYKTNRDKLEEIYKELIKIFLSDHILINQFFMKNSDISWILEKDKANVADSYIAQTLYIDNKFFEDMAYNGWALKYGKDYFQTGIAPYYIYFAQESFETFGLKKLTLNSGNSKYTSIKTDANLVLAHLIFTLIFSDEFEKELSKTSAFGKIETLRKEYYKTLYNTQPIPNINSDNLDDVKEAVRKDSSVYWETIGALPQYKDKYLIESENLDYQNRKNSFFQDGKPLVITSKYLYYDKNFKFFVPADKETIAETIFKKIVSKLKDAKLKSLLKIYSDIENTNKFHYVISAMNIVYMLCECRIDLDEEAKENSCFNPLLSHIYDFMVDMAKKRKALSEDEKTKILTDYNISEAYITMFSRNYLFAMTYNQTYKTNALTFTDNFKTNSSKNKFEKSKYKFVYEKEQSLKSQERELYETLKNMEGYTSKANELLEKIKDENKKKYYIFKNSHTVLKTISNVFVVLKVADFIIFNDNKTYKDCADFAKDVTDLTDEIAGVIALKGSKTPFELINDLTKTVYRANNPKTFLSNITFVNKIAIITTIITTIYDVNDLYKKEDYDAMFLTLFISGTALALSFFSPALPITALTILLNLINMAILTQIKDSDLKIYLQKSLLFKKDIGFFEVFSDVKEKRYKAHYLVEAVETIDNLKAKVNDGFNDPIKLIEFIGKNYFANEKYFDMALTNELSFLKANLFGYKLEKTSYKNSSNLRNPRNIDIKVKVTSAVKVPKVLYDDEKFNLFVINTSKITANNPENNYKKFSNVSKNNIPLVNGNPLFNSFGNNSQYFDLNDFINYKLARKIYTAYIIITSSIIDLKYEVKYLASKTTPTLSSVIIEIDIDEIEQISFANTDINILQGIK